MRVAFAVIATFVAANVLTVTATPQAAAQATCRKKCTEQEQACLKRTGNKSQCGKRAQACLAKCK